MQNHSINGLTGILAIGVVLALPATATAADSNFSFVELNYVNVDTDYSESLSFEGDSFSLSTGADAGFQLAGAFEFGDQWHLYGEYSQAGQDLSLAALIGGEALAASGSFDVVRYRLGVGYAMEMSAAMQAYGRATLDGIEFKDFKVDGESLGDSDDDGFGAEIGTLWAATPSLELQALLRYTSVGKLDEDGGDGFDSDVLFGVSGRWHFTEMLAVQAGYETGDISTWHAGVRLSF
jgi:hypothetical protein